jgi:hypothetical protein
VLNLQAIGSVPSLAQAARVFYCDPFLLNEGRTTATDHEKSVRDAWWEEDSSWSRQLIDEPDEQGHSRILANLHSSYLEEISAQQGFIEYAQDAENIHHLLASFTNLQSILWQGSGEQWVPQTQFQPVRLPVSHGLYRRTGVNRMEINAASDHSSNCVNFRRSPQIDHCDGD